MTKAQFKGAMNAWVLAILEKYTRESEPEEPVEELARQYGSAITTEDDLKSVAAMFDFDRIAACIEK